ncbi:heavy metal translocating P-type ATPase [Corynebacterium tapiri]|uniref:Cation-transporting P-type ATPase B n=1 Tax=Corynebacterium tapiri TaxID=1448266 RepID=A0A5C4U2H2_9CORY|nr:heavy metal translocating P-type ATPase [Corynebacterium tapiri]TNL95351.1 cadmium-translocating P-type ATPase [Corynebacterium tapiri]
MNSSEIPADLSRVELGVTGMTCTSCSSRVQRKLNKLDGVEASVNFATETASIAYDPTLLGTQELIATIRGAGYDAVDLHQSAHDTADPLEEARAAEAESLKTRLLLSAALTVPIVLISMVHPWHFPGWQWVVLVLTLPVFIYGGDPFHRAALTNLRHGSFTMDTLVSLGTTVSMLWSLWITISGNVHHGVYYESAAVVITFLLLGRWWEARAKGRSSAALTSLMHLGAKEATVLVSGAEQKVPTSELSVGDRVIVRPGEKVPADGVVLEGTSAIDASMLTGESIPVEVDPGAHVTGATLNVSGRLLVRVTRVGEDSTLAHITALVTAAQSRKAPIQRVADRVCQYFVPAVLVIAALTFLLHYTLLGNGGELAFTAAVAVLIIACPCALGLATPMALVVGTGRGAQLGILIKGPEVLESSRGIDTIVLDKTGTLTTGQMHVTDVTTRDLPNTTRRELLEAAAAVEGFSEHPIARAIARDLATDTPLPQVTDFQSTAGRGVEAHVDKHRVRLAQAPADLTEPTLAQATSTALSRGATPILLTWDDQPAAVITVEDQVKPLAPTAVAHLRPMGLEPWLLTGDNPSAAAAVAQAAGIDPTHVRAQVLPADKEAHVRELQAQGRTVAMVGDGINDAAALARADLGMAMGAGTDIAIEASDITLMSSDPAAIVDALRLSRRTLSIIRGNLWWAFAYNTALIPVAALGLLDPMLAGIAMAGSSVFVVANSLRLRRFAPEGELQ